MKPVLDNFDSAYVVNLDHDADRMRKVSDRLKRLDISFERFSALETAPERRFGENRLKSRLYSCAMSHATLLRLILQRKHETALILEDDVVFRDDTNDIMKKVARQLAGRRWDILFLGLHLISSTGRISSNLGGVGRSFHAHAYAISQSAIPRMLTSIESVLAKPDRPFESFDHVNLVKLHVIPILAVQEPDLSYTYGHGIDRLPQYFDLFDGNDFEQHCAEMKSWDSNWRCVLGFGDALSHADKLYKAGPLKAAAQAYSNLVHTWPQLTSELNSQPVFVRTLQIVRGDFTSDDQLVAACTWLASALRRSFVKRFSPPLVF